MTGADGSHPLIQPTKMKKVKFDIGSERDAFFEARNALETDCGKAIVCDMPPIFYATSEAGPSWQSGTLQKKFEICLALEKDPDALAEIEGLLQRSARGR